MDTTYFRSYEGREPYMFISYAHLDSARVVPLLSKLKYAPGKTPAADNATKPLSASPMSTAAEAASTPAKAGGKRNAGGCYRIWYDEGIDAGSEWPENIERHMQGAALTVVFWSKASAESKNCYREMVNANESGKPVLFVLLDDTPLPKAQVGKKSKVLSTADATLEEMLRQIVGSGLLHAALVGPDYPAKPQPPWALIACLFALLCAVVGGAVYVTRQQPQPAVPVAAVQTSAPTAVPTETPIEEKPLATFTNPVIADYVYESLQRFDLMPLSIHNAVLRRAVYERLQLPEDAETPDVQALSEIEELHICGDAIAENREDIRMVNGEYEVAGERVNRGKLRFASLREENGDYPVLACMSGLKSLSLCYQESAQTVSIESLSTLPNLAYLDLSGNAIVSDSFSYLWDNLLLTELNLAHTKVSTFFSLNSVPGLAKVYVSRDMLADTVHAFDTRLQFDVIVID